MKMSNRNVLKLIESTKRIKPVNFTARNREQFKNLRFPINYLFKNLTNQSNSASKTFKPIHLLTFGSVMAFSNQTDDLIKKVDELYDANKFDEIENLLNKPELLEQSDKKYEFKWRLARSRYGQVKEKQRNESELDSIRDLVLSALEDNPQCGPAHKVSPNQIILILFFLILIFLLVGSNFG